MTAISLKLPDDLATESKLIADSIGISRTEPIRQALKHELSQIKSQIEREAMARALEMMKGDPVYTHESEEPV
jgi:metal-responsive CopG/Arc/MetJ family transcriptional regulator